LVLHEHDVDAESWDDATRGTLASCTLFGGPATPTGLGRCGRSETAADLAAVADVDHDDQEAVVVQCSTTR
jgi:hypothetical protein